MKDINIKYNKFLKAIVSTMSNSTTQDRQLRSMGSQLFGSKFRGVYPRDKIPRMKHNDMCIFNLDGSKEPGSHWCALYNYKGSKIVYDSFGRRVLGKGYKYTEKDKEQKIKEKNCGQRCLAWLCCVKYYGVKEAIKI